MELIGKVSGTTYSGELIVRAEKMPSLNQRVVDRRKNEIGKVVYIFGSVRFPYALVRPFRKQNTLRLMGREVYTG